MEILFQTDWKVFSVSILFLNNVPEFTACQEKRGSSPALRTCAAGLPASSPPQAESCGVSSLQDKPTFPFCIKPNLLNNTSGVAGLASRNQMAVLFSRVGRRFPVVPFEGWIQAPHASLLCLLLRRLRWRRAGTSSRGNGFHLISRQALWNFGAEACQSHRLHTCKRNRLSVMVVGDVHKYSMCPPSGRVLISLPILLMLSGANGIAAEVM